MIELPHDTDSDSSAVLYSDPDIDDLDINGFADPRTITPLMRAAKSGNIDGVQNALRRRHHVNTPNNQGLTALHFAVIEEHVDIVRLLLENDEINVDVQDWMGMSPLMHACERRVSIDIIKCLLESNCNVHLEDYNRMTALQHAVLQRKVKKGTGLKDRSAKVELVEFNPDIIDILTKQGADINAVSAYNETSISYVMTCLDMDPDTQEYVATALLYYGADPLITRKGLAPLIALTTNARIYELVLPYYRIYDLSMVQRCNIHTVIDIWRTQTEYDKLKFAETIQRSNKNLMQIVYKSAVCINQFQNVCAHNATTMKCNLDCLTEFLHELFGTEELCDLMFTAKMGREMQIQILYSFYGDARGDSMADLLRLSLYNYNKLRYWLYRKLVVRETAPSKIIKVLEDFCVPIQCDAHLMTFSDMNVRSNTAWKMYMQPPSILMKRINKMHEDLFAVRKKYKDYFSADETHTKPRSLLEICRNTILEHIKCANQMNLRNPFGYAKTIKSFPCPQLLKDILLLRRPI